MCGFLIVWGAEPDGSNTNGPAVMGLTALLVAALSTLNLFVAGVAVRTGRLGRRWLILPAATLIFAAIVFCGSYGVNDTRS
jgi:hypothetical protein